MDRRITDKMNVGENTLKTFISESTKITGELTGDHDTIVQGHFDGKMSLQSLLFVKKTGNIKGKIKTENMIIEGRVEGDIIVQNKIELRASGHFDGTLFCKQIAIEDGAFFQGDVSMDDGREVFPTYFKEKRKDL